MRRIRTKDKIHYVTRKEAEEFLTGTTVNYLRQQVEDKEHEFVKIDVHFHWASEKELEIKAPKEPAPTKVVFRIKG